MSTFVHGVASCSAIDTSGEVVAIEGLDITSLARTGTINWEHNMGRDATGKSIAINLPAQVIGKILKAKKIFNQKDCSDEHETHFWNKTKLPFVYIVAELLDDYTASAKECAGQLKYSQANPSLQGILGFSVEGSEIPGTRVNKMLITRSIARKVTLTVAPANKACVAEILENQKPQIKDDFEEIFKTEANAIEMLKSEEGLKIYEQHLAKKEAEGPSQGGKPPKSPYNEYENQGIRIGTTKSGKHVFSHGHIGDYSFNPAEHKEAAEHHRRAAVTADNPKLADNHIQRMAQHNNAAISGGRQENRAALSLKQKDKVGMVQNRQQIEKSEKGGWSPGKVSGDTVHYNHPEHGVVSIQKQPSGEFHVKHQGKMAGVGGVKGSFSDPKVAGAHAKKYMSAIGNKKIHSPKLHNIPSGGGLDKTEGSICELHKARIDEGRTSEGKANARAGRQFRHLNGVASSDTRRVDIRGGSPGQRGEKITSPGADSKRNTSGIHGVAATSKTGGESIAGNAARKGRMNTAKAGHENVLRELKNSPKPNLPKSEPQGDLKKAIEAGSYNAAPSTLTNGAAYQTESMSCSQATTGAEEGQFQATKKKDWNKRAKDDYERWPDREKFEKFMSARMPHLKMGEIKAIGRVISLQKSLNFEKSLENLVSFSKSELDEKSLKEIQKETAEKWAERAEDAYGRAIKEKSVKWLLDADELFHEAIEHSSLSEDLSTFEKIRAKLMPIRKEAFKLLVPGADS